MGLTLRSAQICRAAVCTRRAKERKCLRKSVRAASKAWRYPIFPLRACLADRLLAFLALCARAPDDRTEDTEVDYVNKKFCGDENDI